MGMFDPAAHQSERGTPPPPGEYFVRIADVERKISKGSGAEYLNLKLRIFGGEHDNSTFFDTLSLQDKALWKLSDCCFSLGQTEAFDTDSDQAIRDAMVGKVGKARCNWEEYEGQQRLRVKSWLKIADEERTKLKETPDQYPF
jgi:hypothetical protein